MPAPVYEVSFMPPLQFMLYSAAMEQIQDHVRARILASIPDLVMLFDAERRILWANQSAASAVQKQPADLVGQRCYTVWHEESSACRDCPIAVCIRSGRQAHGEITAPDGETFEIHASPVCGEDGKVIGFVQVARNVTERRELADQTQALDLELHRILRFFDNILDTVADPIFVKDDQHHWIFLNSSFCRFMGVERDKLLGKSDYDFFPQEQADVFWQKDNEVFRIPKARKFLSA